MTDIIVKDKEFWDLLNAYENVGEVVEQELEEYLSCLDKVVNDAVQEGAYHKNLVAFRDEASKLKEQFKEITNELKVNCYDYVTGIDDKDEYLYG